MDRNDNDRIDPEEWESLPPFVRGMWEREGVDLAGPLSYDDFIEKSEAMRARMQSSFRGGPGGGPGGAGPGGSDRARGGDDRGRGGPPGGGSGRGPGFGAPDDFGGSPGDSKDSKPAPKPRIKMTMKLPDSFRSKDKDNDGQIGLYEWPKNDYAGFKKIDHNGDGFLTAQELARGPRSTAVAKASTSSAASTGSTSSSSTSDTASISSSGSKSPGERAFDLLDKDKNTTISEEEWKKSLLVGPTFKKAGIAVSFPLPRGEFLRLYPQAYPPK